MRHFYVVANPHKPGTQETAKEIAHYLTAHGAVCAGMSDGKEARPPARQIPPETECVITLGGDGTLIQAARDLVERRLPLVGVNMGTLGYLTQISRGEALAPMLDALIADNFRLEERMMLEGEVTGGGRRVTGIALNEIVLSRKAGMQPLRFALYVNGQYLNEYTADGMIVATPTGSTAYNLSAGGPIVTPEAELMVLTPICSHSLNSRSIVLSHQDTVSIRIRQQEGQSQMVVFDGDQAVELADDETLTIRRSKNGTSLIRLKDISFLDNLRNKMSRV